MQEKIKTEQEQLEEIKMQIRPLDEKRDRKSTRLNSSHL